MMESQLSEYMEILDDILNEGVVQYVNCLNKTNKL